MVFNSDGIFRRAKHSAKITKIKGVEELARMLYMERKVDEIKDGTATTMGEVVNDLKEHGYNIKQDSGGIDNIIGIALSEEKVVIERNTNKTLTYTFIYSPETTVRYFVEIQGSYYEMYYNNGNITVSSEEAVLNTQDKKADITIESSDINIIEATKIEDGKIIITAKDKVGDVEIKMQENNSGVTKKFIATTKIQATGVRIIPTTAEVKVGKTANLTAKVEPDSTINKTVTWSSSNNNIATVSSTGVVKAISRGTTTITATTADGSNISSNVCTITVLESTLLDEVKENANTFYGKKVKGYTANGVSDWRIFYTDGINVFIISTDYISSSKAIACNNTMVASGDYAAKWTTIPGLCDVSKVDKFSPVTAETARWTGGYNKDNGKVVSTLLDTNKWVAFKNDKAVYAIGGATLNMWVASWNEKYPKDKLYCNRTNSNGYYIGTVNNPGNSSIIISDLEGRKLAEEDNMYFPHHGAWNGCEGYWLSSPAAYATSNLFNVWGYGYIGNNIYTSGSNGTVGIRPVVCLNIGVKIIEITEKSVTIE